MSLARAFTTRRSKNSLTSPPVPQRSATTKGFPTGTIRHKISGPVELLSTTNMLSYNAPDLFPESGSSISGDESDSVPSLVHSPGASSSAASSLVDSVPSSPEPNHLSCYFGKESRQSTSSNEDLAPKIPSRALSHTKRTHEIIHRQRSVSRRSSQRKASITAFARDSLNMFSSNPELMESEPTHPFGSELAQVTELAEEFGVRAQMQIVDAEEQDLIARGLFKFQAQDYLDEIQGLFFDTYGMSDTPAAMWI